MKASPALFMCIIQQQHNKHNQNTENTREGIWNLPSHRVMSLPRLWGRFKQA